MMQLTRFYDAVCVLIVSFNLTGDIAPGEAIFVSLNGTLTSQILHPSPSLSPCIFEYVYFSRPDSVLDGVSVYEARKMVSKR